MRIREAFLAGLGGLKCLISLLSLSSHHFSSFVEIPVLFSLITLGNKLRRTILLPKIIHLPTGHKVTVPQDDLTGFLSSFDDVFMKREYFTSESFFSRKDQVIVDAGAHMGFFALKALDLCNNRCIIVAVEPGPDNFSILLSNIMLNHLAGRVIPVNYALSDHEGSSKLYLSQQAGAGHTLYKRHLEVQGFVSPKSIDVRTTTLDKLLLKLGINHVDLLKIDVEGAEIDVLRGGVHDKYVSKLIIEVHKKINNPVNVKKALEDMGYTIVSHVYTNEMKDVIHAKSASKA